MVLGVFWLILLLLLPGLVELESSGLVKAANPAGSIVLSLMLWMSTWAPIIQTMRGTLPDVIWSFCFPTSGQSTDLRDRRKLHAHLLETLKQYYSDYHCHFKSVKGFVTRAFKHKGLDQSSGGGRCMWLRSPFKREWRGVKSADSLQLQGFRTHHGIQAQTTLSRELQPVAEHVRYQAWPFLPMGDLSLGNLCTLLSQLGSCIAE